MVLNRKKGMVVLLVTGFAFLIASILFLSVGDKLRPGFETKYLGETEINVFNMYHEGEKVLLYLDVSVRLSIEKALAEGNKSFKKNFKEHLSDYLDNMNQTFNTQLSIDKYSFTFEEGGVIGKTSDSLVLKREGMEYKVHPNFRFECNLTGFIIDEPTGSSVPLL